MIFIVLSYHFEDCDLKIRTGNESVPNDFVKCLPISINSSLSAIMLQTARPLIGINHNLSIDL